MKKRLIFSLLFITMTTSVLTAEPPTITFTASDGVTLTKEDVDATLEAKGLTRESEFNAVSNAIKIGEYAFWNCYRLASVDFSNVTFIDFGAFMDCFSLVSVDFPVATDIGGEAFAACSSLVSVNFPAATDMGYYTFWNCSRLKNVNFPTAMFIGVKSFWNCSRLENVNFPTATTIGGYAFGHCSMLKNVDFPTATDIEDYAFGNCSMLENVNFPIATTIGHYAFMYCFSLVSVDFPTAINIGGYAFEHCIRLVSVDFPAAINIGSYAFEHCDALEKVMFGVALSPDTEINFYSYYVFDPTTTPNIDLYLGEGVLPLPDTINNTWQTTTGKNSGTPYKWKSINIKSSVQDADIYDIMIVPNPAESDFNIIFDNPETQNISIKLLDISGRKILDVFDGIAAAGKQIFPVNTKLTNGTYFAKILVSGKIVVRKVIVK